MNELKKVTLNKNYISIKSVRNDHPLNGDERTKKFYYNEIFDSSYMITDGDNIFAGRHLLFDFWNTGYEKRMKETREIMIEGLRETGARILYSHFHEFGIGGFTGLIMLQESHASVHTWPESHLMTFDIYMCGTCDPEISFRYYLQKFSPVKMSIHMVRRGVVEIDPLILSK